MSPEEANKWSPAAALVCIGALVLFIGLMLGPTPGNDTALALERIDLWYGRYVATNGIDLIGVLILTLGLFLIARLQASNESAWLPSGAAMIGCVTGGVLILVVLVIQSTVDPALASRFVHTDDADKANQLAIAKAMFDFEGGLFGLGLTLEMTGIASLALGLLLGTAPAISKRLILPGIPLTALAGVTGLGSLLNSLEFLTRIEALFSLAVLLWLVVMAAAMVWSLRRPSEAGHDAVSRTLRHT